jgi:hypothetical protein
MEASWMEVSWSPSVRLRLHPQVQQIEHFLHTLRTEYGIEPVFSNEWLFDCAACGQRCDVEHAHPQPDGTLRCPSCSAVDRKHRLEWCPGCKRSLTPSAFKQEPIRQSENRPAARRILAMAADWLPHRQCADCRSRHQREHYKRRCGWCGEPFDPGVWATLLYCSHVCEIRAHRQAMSGSRDS